MTLCGSYKRPVGIIHTKAIFTWGTHLMKLFLTKVMVSRNFSLNLQRENNYSSTEICNRKLKYADNDFSWSLVLTGYHTFSAHDLCHLLLSFLFFVLLPSSWAYSFSYSWIIHVSLANGNLRNASQPLILKHQACVSECFCLNSL